MARLVSGASKRLERIRAAVRKATGRKRIDYGHQADRWQRREPKFLADLVGKPQVFDWFQGFGKNSTALDLGCGADGFAQRMASVAKNVIAVDSSREMIKRARELGEPANVKFRRANALRLPFVKSGSIGVCVSNLLANYFHPKKLPALYREISRILSPEGHFLFLIPNPRQALSVPFGDSRWNAGKFDYQASRGRFFKGTLETIDGKKLEVGMFHSTIEDHANAIRKAGLELVQILEPQITKEIAGRHAIYRGDEGKMPYVILVGKKPAQ
jgi:SAM-dependent methyltransferase